MEKKNPVQDTLSKARKAFFAVGLLSCVVNLLMLTGPLFMLQIYDRVLASQSIPTLAALFGLVIGLYTMMGMFDFIRTRVLSRFAYWLDNRLSPDTYKSWIAHAPGGQSAAYRPLQDIGIIRSYIASPTILALFDLPWFPFYLAIVFILHVHLGLLAVGGVVVVVILALLNEWLSRKSAGTAATGEMLEVRFADQARRNADSILTMGMLDNTHQVWKNLREDALYHQQTGGEKSEGFTTGSKAFRLLLQSSMLGMGAWLAIYQEITAGMIVAASIIAGRALAPVDQTIGGWRLTKRAWLAYKRLSEYLAQSKGGRGVSIDLPEPEGKIEIASVVKYAPRQKPDQDKYAILSGLSFSLMPGDGLGVIGPSASGKSSLAKLLVGLWMPDHGSVRIDGATFEQWDTDHLGRYIGYLPQQVELLSGTIAQNISRFTEQAKDDEVVEAAKLAGVHEMILSFPDGYSTNVDAAVSPLTGGQKQRIGLARAIYGKPKLIVLDEPNSNLDQEGDSALRIAIETMRSAGSVVVVIAHRPSAISAVDKVLMLNNGRITEFGEKAEIIKKVTRAA